MEQITLRIQSDVLDSIDSEAVEHGISRSEHIRNIVKTRNKHGDAKQLRQRVDDLEAKRDQLIDEVEQLEKTITEVEAEIETLEARNTDLTNQLAEANRRIDAANELVRYVDDERSAQQRWREAGLFRKMKYTVLGMPTHDETDN
jgi:bZIP transcription factor.